MRKMRVMGAMLLGGILLLVGTGVVLAEEGEATPDPQVIAANNGERCGLVGVVAEESNIEGGIILLETRARGEVEVILNGDTAYKLPGQSEASKDDVAVGKRVAILALDDEDGQYTALQVMVIPEKATRRHVNGVVVSQENKTMTITNADGETITVEIPDGVRYGAVGSHICAAVRNYSGSGNAEATCTQTMEQVQERIRACIGQLDDDSSGTPNGDQSQITEQLRQRLTEKLNGLMECHENTLRNVLQRHAGEEIEGPIQEALQNAERFRLHFSESSQQGDPSGTGDGQANQNQEMSTEPQQQQQQGSGS